MAAQERPVLVLSIFLQWMGQRNPAPPNGWLKPFFNNGINHLSTGAGFFPSTVSGTVTTGKHLGMVS